MKFLRALRDSLMAFVLASVVVVYGAFVVFVHLLAALVAIWTGR